MHGINQILFTHKHTHTSTQSQTHTCNHLLNYNKKPTNYSFLNEIFFRVAVWFVGLLFFFVQLRNKKKMVQNLNANWWMENVMSEMISENNNCQLDRYQSFIFSQFSNWHYLFHSSNAPKICRKDHIGALNNKVSCDCLNSLKKKIFVKMWIALGFTAQFNSIDRILYGKLFKANP